MHGPTIVSVDPGHDTTGVATRSRFEGRSGVYFNADRRVWVAIRNGRWAGEHPGSRGFLAATRSAGSSQRLA